MSVIKASGDGDHASLVKTPVAVIVGAVLGGVAAVLLLILLGALCVRDRKRKLYAKQSATPKSHMSMEKGMFAPIGGKCCLL